MAQTEAVVSYFEIPIRSLNNSSSSLGFNTGATEYSAISVPAGQQSTPSTTVNAHHIWFGSTLAAAQYAQLLLLCVGWVTILTSLTPGIKYVLPSGQ